MGGWHVHPCVLARHRARIKRVWQIDVQAMESDDPWSNLEQADIGVAQSLKIATRAYAAIGTDGTVPLYSILGRLAPGLIFATDDEGRLVVRPGVVPPPPKAKPPPAFVHAVVVPPKAPNVPAAPPKAPNPPPAPPPAGRAAPIPNAPPPKAPNPPPAGRAAPIPKPPPQPPQAKQHPVGQVRQYPGPPAGAVPRAPRHPPPPDVFPMQWPEDLERYREDYFNQLPSFAYTVDEQRLRNAVLMFLRQWPRRDPPTLRDVERDHFVAGVIGDCLPWFATLKDWINYRSGCEVQLRRGQERGNPTVHSLIS